jgi:hypothetical protein
MFEQYLAALLGLRQARDLAPSALPDAPVQPDREDRNAEAAPALRPVVARPRRPSELAPCPCSRWGITRGDHHGCLALVRELFPQLDRELDAWEDDYGWLYR